MPARTFNHAAVWTSAIGAGVLAYVWFHVLFYDAYVRGLGRATPDRLTGHNAYEGIILQLAGNLVTAYVLGWFFRHLHVTRLTEGLALTVVIWFGFVGAVHTPVVMAGGFPLYYLAIIAGAHLTQLLLMASVLAVWRPPGR